MKIGILGGSFNPAHEGHLEISKMALKKFSLSSVWWSVAKKNPLKNSGSYVDYLQRLEYCRQYLKNNPKIKVNNIFPEAIYTYDFIKKIKKKYPRTKFYFIVGADCLENMHLWKNYKGLFKEVEFIVFARSEFLRKAFSFKAWHVYKKMTRMNNLPKFNIVRNRGINISSSQIRQHKH